MATRCVGLKLGAGWASAEGKTYYSEATLSHGPETSVASTEIPLLSRALSPAASTPSASSIHIFPNDVPRNRIPVP